MKFAGGEVSDLADDTSAAVSCSCGKGRLGWGLGLDVVGGPKRFEAGLSASLGLTGTGLTTTEVVVDAVQTDGGGARSLIAGGMTEVEGTCI